jgi:hypothetical protein
MPDIPGTNVERFLDACPGVVQEVQQHMIQLTSGRIGFDRAN